MTDTTITLPTRPSEPTSVAEIPAHPTDIMMNVIVAFLAPMFLACSGGNIAHARLAAIETVNAYRGKTHADLFSIAQIIGFGLAALGSLSLSMADDISLTMTLRLRGNAVALNRGAEQNRRALQKSLAAEETRHDPAPAERSTPAAEPRAQPSPTANLQNVTVEPQDHTPPVQQRDQPAPPAAPVAHATALTMPTDDQHDQTLSHLTGDQQSQLAWATVMADEAALLMASIADLPPEERETAARHAAALTRTANTLRVEINGSLPEPSTAIPLPGQGPSPLHL